MARKRSLNPTERRPARSLSLVPSAEHSDPTPRRYRLGSMCGIRRELSQVYRLARSGELELSNACRFAYLLSTLSKISEAELLEDRLARLEHTLEEKENGNKH